MGFRRRGQGADERVRKFFGAIPDVVELRRLRSADEARGEAGSHRARSGLKLDPAVARSAGGGARRGHRADRGRDREAGALCGRAESPLDDMPRWCRMRGRATIFALVNALGRRDRARSLEILDTLTREGEYLPLALAFLVDAIPHGAGGAGGGAAERRPDAGALHRAGGADVGIARGAGLSDGERSSRRRKWSAGMKLIFQADRGLRDARPDDRTVVENFVDQTLRVISAQA